MVERCEIAIVGGGMAGQVAALALAQAGFDVALVERHPGDAHLAAAFDGRASSLAYGSKLVLEGLGLWQAIAAQAQPIWHIRVSEGATPFFLHYRHSDVGEQPLGWMVENRHLRRALAAAVAAEGGVRVMAPATVAAMETDSAGAVLTLAGGGGLRSSLVLACDGAASPLRAMAGIGAWRRAYGQTGIVCAVRHRRPHRGIAHERFLPSGPFAILPLGGRRSSLVWTERDDIAAAVLAADDADICEEIAWRFGDFLGEVAPVGQLWSYPLALTLAHRVRGRRLALVGDAAHAIHPIAGQGYNLAIRAIAVLAEELAQGRRLGLDAGDDGPLRAYARRRRADTLALVAVTHGLNRLFSNAFPPAALARGLGLAATDRMVPLKRIFMRHAMGILGRPLPAGGPGRPPPAASSAPPGPLSAARR